ncbi:MAG: FMN-binding protein [Sedimentisphaerales bacterium]|nr:FMN-binding protein [Sedimentisphaerales bacterium]
MREKRWFAPVYMFIVTAMFSSVVIGFARRTQNLVEANARLALETAVLQVIPQLYSEDASRLELHRIFVEQVSEPTDESGGAYVYKKDSRIEAYAVPFSGRGFWATISGVVGVKPDKKTVTGIAFYEQSETPGLGAEITKPAFKNQFPGRILAQKAEPLKMKRPGEPLAENEYHAVTGATQTSTRLEKIINDALVLWREKLEKGGGTN